MRIIPSHSTFAPGSPVDIAVEGAPAGAWLTIGGTTGVTRTVDEVGDLVVVEPLPVGGYGVDAWSSDGALLASSAFDVLADPMDRPRYGFVARFGPDVDVPAVRAHALRLHLNVIQHYDWAFSYTELVGPEEYSDMLGNQVSMPVLRALLAAFRDIGARALGYAALYGVPAAEWDRWAPVGLYRSTGEPYGFGDDFLNVVDPGAPQWRATIVPAIEQAFRQVGFDGFHLDQYGWPKRALRADGTVTDLTETLPALVDEIAGAVPDATLIFNNVNGFPLERSAHSRQHALYTEVWPPRVDLRDLAALVAQSRAASALPVIVAAYLSVFREVGGTAARDAARLTMATIFSSGATHLLAGEDGRLLVHPYYVSSERAEGTTLAMLERWYTFLVRHGDLLLDAPLEDVTGAYAGEYNADVVVEAPPGVQVSVHADPGAVWLRVMRTRHGLVAHLVNLVDQEETGWDAPKRKIRPLTGLRLRMRQVEARPSAVRWHDPDVPGPGTWLPAVAEGIDQVTELPPLDAWAMVHISTQESQ